VATLLDHSCGVATETTWNIPKTPDHWYEWLESSGLDWDPNTINASGLRVGSKFARASRRTQLVPRGMGKLEFELASKGFGPILGALFGTSVSTNVAGALYQQLFTATTATSFLPTLTVQEGLVRADGTVDAYTWRGCTVKSGELALPSNGLATCKVDLDARSMHVARVVTDGATTISTATVTSATGGFSTNDIGAPITGTNIPASTTIIGINSATSITISANATATGSGLTLTFGSAYTTPTYPSNATLYSSALALTVASITIGGTLTVPTTTALGTISGGTVAAAVKDWTLTLDNGVDGGRDVVGGRNQATTGKRVGTLKTTVEYDSTTGVVLQQYMVNQTQVAMLVNAQTPEIITAGNPATFQIATPVAAIDSGAIPQPTAGTVATTTLSWSVLDGLVAGSALYGVLRTADTAL
jgi:hypothetical protein